MDIFESYTTTLNSPARGGTAITPNDAALLSQVTRAIYVGQAGNVAVRLVDGGTVIFKGVPAGSVLPVRADLVPATGTTASDIIGLW